MNPKKHDPIGLRLKEVSCELEKQKLDAFLVLSAANISYMTEFNSRDAYLLLSKKKNFYVTDARYTQETHDLLDKRFRVVKTDGSPFRIIAGLSLKSGIKKIGFEEKYLSFFHYQQLRNALPRKTLLVPFSGVIEELRQLKSRQELQKIKKAIEITRAALRSIRTKIVAGKSELQIAAELERFIRFHGASGSAFNIIVASGPNSSFPHHVTGPRVIKDNEPVVIDIGVDYHGYKSDLTRVFFLGRITPLAKRGYDIVRQAQLRALGKIRPAAPIRSVDAAARSYIRQKGYGKFFLHSLGHGVGLEVHEEPKISQKETRNLLPGMVFTIEPGIYLPGKFGIRIEDMVLVTEKGVELLSGSLNQ